MNRRPDPDSVRWAIAATIGPEPVALILSIVTLLGVLLLLATR